MRTGTFRRQAVSQWLGYLSSGHRFEAAALPEVKDY
jgi:hypothetical protein